MSVLPGKSVLLTLFARTLLVTTIVSVTMVFKGICAKISMSVPYLLAVILMLHVRTVKAALSALVTEAFSEMEKSVGKVSATIDDVLPVKNAFQRQVISVHAKEG